MDRLSYLKQAQQNIIAYAVLVILGFVAAFSVGINALFFIGVCVGASIHAIVFQSANTKTFMLFADMVEAVQRINATTVNRGPVIDEQSEDRARQG